MAPLGSPGNQGCCGPCQTRLSNSHCPSQYLANRCLVPGHEAVIARKARRLLGDDPEAHRVMIATSDDRRPGRRAKCCRVEVGIAQTVGSDLIQGRRRDDTAERAGNAKTGIVGHNQEDVRCALGWHHACWPPGYRLRGVALDLAFELLLRAAADGCPGLSLSRLASPPLRQFLVRWPRRSAQWRQEGQASGRASLLSWATSQHVLPPISLVLNIAPTNGALMKPRRVKFTHLSWLMLAE